MTTDRPENNKISVGLLGFGVRLRSVVRKVVSAGAGRIGIGAIHDPNPEAVRAAIADHGDGVAVYESEEAFLDSPGLDWVFIGSENHLHADQIIRALRRGKHVFCEKPLATSLEDGFRVREAIEESGRRFALGLVLRYSPFYQQVDEIVARGEIGRIVSFEFNETLDFDHGGRRIFSTWRRDFDRAGSHLLEKCCHDIDLANWLIGSLPVQVASFGGLGFFTPENARHVERIGKSPDGRDAYCERGEPPRIVHPFSPGASIVDHQVAILEYANGVRATFHTNCNTALRERRFYLCGTEGTLNADAYSGVIEWRRIGYGTRSQRLETLTGGGHGHAGGDQIMTDRLVEAMLHGGELLASVDDGIRSCAVAFAIDEAMVKKQVVDLGETWLRCGIDPAAPRENYLVEFAVP
ncbi:MAG TPA: Gfo/Idh/MocA family oxidoreductase [Chthoniobacteraceae bacterium]|nr:Gfo/Idh/MocA family oxidoreductase [Chthoniobacteraceae bacterium]